MNMTYLNDVPNGGTEFYYQGLKSPAKKGLTLIWPADWTHTHRGIVDDKNEKYIVTGWYNYETDKLTKYPWIMSDAYLGNPNLKKVNTPQEFTKKRNFRISKVC
jgi:hypothetical protein